MRVSREKAAENRERIVDAAETGAELLAYDMMNGV